MATKQRCIYRTFRSDRCSLEIKRIYLRDARHFPYYDDNIVYYTICTNHMDWLTLNPLEVRVRHFNPETLTWSC